MIKRLFLVFSMLAAASNVLWAQGRPDTRKMTCEQVQSLIHQRGGVVLTTGQYTYDRYVAGRRWCDYPAVPVSVRVPTKDTNSCMVKNCQNIPLDDLWGRW